MKRILTLVALPLIAAAAWLAAAPASAQGRFLAKEDILLYGLGLEVAPVEQTVPKDIATIVSTYLHAPQIPDSLPPFAPDAVVKGTLRGPGLPVPLALSVQPNSPFNIPPLTVAGIYSLDDIRLESGGGVLLRATPESVKITVIDKLLVTQITARPLTAAEIREKGIVFDASNFQAYNFTAAFAVSDGTPVNVNFPVVIPSIPPVSDTSSPSVTIGTVQAPTITSLKTVVPDTLKIAATQIPNLAVVGFSLKVPQIEGQTLMVPPIPGVIVIPGDIGFLNQYFSVMLMVGNAAPAGSGLSVTDLRAEILLPAGNDRVANSVDDPLRMAMTERGEAPRLQAVVQAGPDGQLGTADDLLTLEPGQSGNAEFLVEGRREGSHAVEMAISGTLLGLPVGPVPVTGRAAGAVLVRNPTFTLTFTHPETVMAGEQYTLDVTVTNTSTSPANFVSVNLFAPNVSGASVIGEPTREVESIPPGDSATVSFDLVSRVTGKVTAATLDSDENVAGRFQLKTAVGADGVPLSPDSLVLPKEASSLPKSLRDAALGLLGKAWAVATAPAGALPKEVARFSKQIVLDRAVEVAEAGLRVSLHEPLPDSAAQLLMDFAGSNYPRIPELFPAADVPFHLSNFTGFDALRRSSIRGDVFAAAVADLLRDDLEASGAAAFHRSLASKWGYRPGFLSVLLYSTSGPAPFDIAILDAQGRRVGGSGSNGKLIKEIPFSDVLAFTAGGAPRGTLLLIAAPAPGTYSVRLTRVAGTSASAPSTLSILSPASPQNGDVRQLTFDEVTASTLPSYTPVDGDPIRFTFEMVGDDVQASPVALEAGVHIVPDAPPSVVSVVQQAQADQASCDEASVGYPFGRVVAVLFSEEVTAASVQDRLAAERITAFAPEANSPVAVALQPGRRVAFVAMRRPFGPYVPRTMTVSGVEDLRRHPMETWSGPMEATVGDHGAVVSGRIIQADGAAVAGGEVRLFAILPCANQVEALGATEKKVGISTQHADAEGRYSWDFVNSDVRSVVTAIDPVTSEWRTIAFDISRPGQRMNVDIVLLGRGTFMGRVLSPDGRTPLAESRIRVTSLTDHSQYGATTDDQGAFVIPRIPVGNIFVEAVNVAANAHYNFSEYLPFAGATVTRDIVLVAADSVQQVSAVFAALSGHVLQADGATPVAGAPVVAFYQNMSQPGVACPVAEGEAPSECAVGVATTAADGSFGFDKLAAGRYRIYAFDQPSLSQGEVSYVLAEGGGTLAILLSGGLATVQGVVLDSTGAKVAGARVGGGLSLTTTDENGAFFLPDVPVGRRTIVAVSDAMGVTGSAEVDIVRAGEVVNATIVMPVSGSVAGRVVLADGTTPAANVTVYLFQQKGGEDGPRIVVSGQATTDATGAYRIDRVLADQYQVSAFASDFSDGNVVPAVLRYPNQVVRADIRFRGAGGRVSGTVLNSDGTTPLVGRVGLSGYRALIAGGQVGVGFVPVTNYAIVDTGLDGKFSFNGLFVGDFTLRAVGPFSPDPIEESGRIESPGQQVTLDLRLQATSQVAGIVYQPDGVTPAPNVNVTYKSDEFRLVCSASQMTETGDPSCEAVPQGVQAEYAVTDADGRFLVPLVNAGAFTLSFEDPSSGRVAQVRGAVRPGERAEIEARLLGRGELTVRVIGSDGHTPIPGARVDVRQPEFPKASLTMYADAQGTLVLGGGDALSEGEVTIAVRDVRNGFTGRASARISSDAEQVSVNVYIFDASGTVSGTVYRPDGITPAPNAEVVISVNGKAIGYTVAGADGSFSQDTIPLGPFAIDVFEASTGRIGYASGSIDLDKQQVTVNVTEVAMGLVTGTVIDSSIMSPLAGWSVVLTPKLASGRQLPPLRGMSAADGRFSFPGVAKGIFAVTASKPGTGGNAAASGEIYAEGQALDVPLLVRIAHPLFGSIEGTVFNPDGTPAPFATVAVVDGPETVAAADGSFSFPPLQLGRYQLLARSQTTANAGSAWVDLAFNGDIVRASIVMVGLTSVHGQVVYADNSPASGAQVTFTGVPSSGCEDGCTKYADASGQFSFTQLPARSFTLWATAPLGNLKGSVGGPLNPGEDKALRVVLQPSATVQGRVLTAGGIPAAGVLCELRSGEQQLFLGTDAEGRFSYQGVPLAPFALDFSDPVGPGIAHRAGTLTGDVNLGDVLLDEAPPQVVSLTPAASATRVPLDQVVTIVFSEPIDPAGVNASAISLSGPDGAVTSLLALGGGDTTVTLSPLGALRDEARYTLRLTGIKDRLGKVMADYAASFTTVDITPPTAIDLSPAPSTSGVPIYSPVRIKFSEPIDPSAWGATPLSLTLGGEDVAGRLDYLYGNTVVVFTPSLPLADGALYRVQLAAATDLSGNVQAAALDFSFSTTDRTPPQIAALSSLTGPAIIENTVARVRPDFGAAADVLVVDYYLNGSVAGSSRTAPFDFAFQAVPALGSPGAAIAVTAIATDTSGNRGLMSAPLSITVAPDVPPAIAVTSPAPGSSFRNGARITVTIAATDDVGLVALGYRAQTGRPQDAATVQVSPTSTEGTATFAFYVPDGATPGSAIEIHASAVDTKGQSVAATPVSFTVLDGVGPSVSISGSASGDKVKAGQTVTVAVSASDAGGLERLAFTAAGAGVHSEARTIAGAPASLVTAFTFNVSPTAATGDTVALDATATDVAGNAGSAARVVLTVSDITPPTVSLRAAGGGTTVLPNQAVDIVAEAADDQAVARVDLAGTGAFTVSDSRQVSPPSNSATLHFTVIVPAVAAPGTTLALTARATDVAGNVSGPGSLVLVIGSSTDVTMPGSVVMLAGEAKAVPVQLGVPAPAGGQVVTFTTGDTSIAVAPSTITIPEGSTEGSITVTAVAGGTTPLRAHVQGAVRATTTIAVQGGVISGLVLDDVLAPVAGAEVTVGNGLTTTTDPAGFYQVTGVAGSSALVKAVDPATHKRGSATAQLNVANGFARNVNVVLIAAGGVNGTVFLADGVTPAGAGVQVDIYDQSQPSHSLATVFTGEGSGYEFPVVTEGSYNVEAGDTHGNRGRATAVVVSGQDTTSNVSYLGRGTVTGTVRDGAGAPVPNAALVFNASSIFGLAPATSLAAEPDGTFTVAPVFVGSFWIRATDPRTGQGGVASGVVGHDQETVTVAVNVSSFGSLVGTVYRSDGTTTVANARVVARAGDYTYLWATTDAAGRYEMPVVPLGTYTVEVNETATRAVGRTTATIASNGEVVTADVTMAPQGTLVITVVDASSQPVEGAHVTVTARSDPYRDTLAGTTGADGRLVISNVLAGTITVEATWGGLSGSADAILSGGAVLPVTVQLEPVASVAGSVLMPDGETPAAGTVRLMFGDSNPQGAPFRQATLAPDGTYRFDGVPLNRYKVYAYDAGGRWRAVSYALQLVTPGEVATADLTFVGLGSVAGRVLNVDSSSAGGARVEVRSLNATFGGYFTTVADAAGYYQVTGVPVGPIAVLAGSVASGVFAEASGTLPADAETVVIDLLLKNNSTYFPVTLHDANGYLFEVGADGMIKRGQQYVFDEAGGGGLKLEIESGGAVSAFKGATIGTLEANGRQVVAREQGVGGLDITRRVYVPLDGYFARYVDVLTNPGTSPVTVNVWLTSYVRLSTLLATSSGDAVLDVADQAAHDRWFTIDDSSDSASGTPSLAFVFDGAGAASRAAAAAFVSSNSAVWRWDQVTVPAGGSVAFMHFVAQQETRASGQAAAERLAQLPPEALSNLRQEELAAVVNFAVPAGGTSGLAALPALNGVIAGQTLEADAATTVPWTQVTYTSSSPYFARVRQFYSDASGVFRIESQLDGTSQSVPVPVDGFTLVGRYPSSNVSSPLVAGAFPAGQSIVTQDIVFSTTARITGSVRRAGGTVVTSGTVTAAGTLNGQPYNRSTQIGPDGSFAFTGQPAIALTLTASVPHPQGSAVTASTGVALTAGQTLEVTIVLPATGSVQGTVRTGGGAPASGVTVRLSGSGSFARTTTTDTSGAYVLSTVPAGTYAVAATEPASGLETSAAVTVSGDEAVTQDLQLAAVGIVRGTVRNASNQVAAGVAVTLTTSVAARGTLQTQTNASGAYQFAGVPLGSFLVGATSTTLGQYGEASGTVSSDGEQVVADITMASNIISLPRNRYDGNSLKFDLQQNGRIRYGYNSAFTGYSSSSTSDPYGASRLSLVAAGVETAFAGAATAIGEQGNRELAIRQQGLAGLDVTRKVYLPETGYFARYLEILSNPGTEPVTVDVKVASSLGYGASSYWWGWTGNIPAIRATSNGDTAIDVASADAADRWVVFDDSEQTDLFAPEASGNSLPATAFVFDGAGAGRRVDSAVFTKATWGDLTYAWNGVTVPAGGRVILMHFVVQQSSTAAGIASAERLVQLPPEAIAGIAEDERPQIANHSLPADGTSALEGLPALTGTVTGRVLESDGTPVNYSTVAFASSVPYFSRSRTAQSDATGAFRFASAFTQYASTVIPVDAFTLKARHPKSSIESPAASGAFAEGQATATQDIVFSNTGTITGYLRKQSGVAVPSNYVTVQAGSTSYGQSTDGTGRFTFRGLAPGTWTLQSTLSTSTWLVGTASTTAAAGETTEQDVVFPPTGTLQGVVYTAAGARTTYTTVYIVRPSDGASYYAYTSDGSYVFRDVPLGSYTVYASDPRTSARTEMPVAIAQDQVTTQDIVLPAAGSLQVQVNYARGVAAGGARVDVKDAGTGGSFGRTIFVDAAGRGTVSNVAAGPITVRAYNPSDSNFYAEVETSLTTEGQVVPVTVTLPAVVTIKAHAAVSTGTPVANASAYLYASSDTNSYLRSATTDATGTATFSGLFAGGTSYTVRAQRYVSSYNGYYLSALSSPFTPTTDGETATAEVTLPAVANATVALVKPDGTSFGSASLYVKNDYRTNFESQGYTSSSTGQVAVPLPQGGYTIRVKDYNTGASLLDFTGTIDVADEGRAFTITIPVGSAAGTVTGRVLYADGVTPMPNAYVSLVNVMDNTSIGSTYAAADGRYTFSNVRAGTGGFVVRVRVPSQWSSAYPTLVEVPGSISSAGQTLTLDVTMPYALVTLSGTSRDAEGTTPIPYAPVKVTTKTGTTVWSGNTNDTGGYGPVTFLASVDGVVIRAYEPAGVVFAEQTHVPGSGAAVVVLNVPVYAGSVAGQVVAGDGVTAVRYAELELRSAAGRLRSIYADSSGSFSDDSLWVPTSGAVLEAWYSDGTAADTTPALVPVDFSSNRNLTLTIPLPLSVVRGSVRRADGSVPGSFAAWTVGADSVTREPMTRDTAQGTYVILGNPAGPFTTYASDYYSPYFTGFTETAITDASTPAIVDVKLPASGQVEVRALSPEGLPMEARVALSAPRAFPQDDWYTDSVTGEAIITAPIGPVSLQSCPYDQPCATVSGEVVAGQPLQLDLAARPTGTLQGRMLKADGVTPYANTSVYLESQAESGWWDHWTTWADTDADGRFVVQGVPAGSVTVELYDYSVRGAIRVPVTVVAGKTNSIEASGGSGVETPSLASGGAVFSPSYGGQISSASLGSLGNPYSYSYEPILEEGLDWEWYYPDASLARKSSPGTQLEFGPVVGASLILQRKVGVPGNKPFVRYIETVRNPTAVPLPVSVRIQSNMRDINVVTGAEDTNSRYVITGPPSGVSRAAVAHVIAGGGAVRARAGVLLEPGSEFEYVWSTIVPPGGTVEFMHFSVLGDPADIASLQAQAEALATLSDPDALFGLTAEEKGRIVNFNVPGGAAPISGNIVGTVVAADGTTPLAGVAVKAVDAVTGYLRASATTDGNGAFRLDGVSNGEEGLAVTAALPSTPGAGAGDSVTFATDGQEVSLTLVMPAGAGGGDSKPDLPSGDDAAIGPWQGVFSILEALGDEPHGRMMER